MAEQKDYKYYAFISYSRKNSKAAAYFHRQLEHFRIPVKYVAEENRPPKQKFLRPIFRDRRDLEATEDSFTDDIKKALEQSRYLIVLCSPESARSKWVDEEIKCFLETHNNDYTLIVPVILVGEPGAEGGLECLPTSLRLKEIVERNLPSMIPDESESEKAGWLTGVVQSMSYMLKVSREKIRATVDAEKVRQAKIYSFIGIICTVIFAGLAFWAIKAERIAESNRINAENNWRIAEQNRIVAESNQRKAEINERRALAGEKDAMEKKELSDKTLEFVQKMLQDGKPDEHGPKKVIDLLTEQISKIELLEPEELRYSVSFLIGQIMLEQGLLKPAERLLITSFNYFKQDGNDLGAVGAANILGVLYATSSRIEEAEKMYKYIEDKNNIKSNGIFDQSLLLFNMACVYRQTKNIEKAEELCLKALRLENKDNGILRVKMSCFLANIAFARGDYKRSEEYYSIAEKETQDCGLETSLEMLELKAGLRKVNGEYDKARSIYESAIEKEKIRDRGKSFISGILMNDLGILEMDVGNHEKALKCFEEAVLIGEHYAQDGSLNLAMIYNNIGNVLCSLKSYVRAQEYYDKALIMAKKFGEESSQVITILRNLGHIEYEKGGGREKLRNLLLQIKDMSVRVYGPSNAEEGYAQYMLSKISMEKGDHTQALTQIEEALRIYDLLKRDDEGLYAHMLNDYALIQDKLGMDSNAVVSINKAYKIAQSKLSVKDRANIMRNHELILGMEKTHPAKDGQIPLEDIEKLKDDAQRSLNEGRYDEANQFYAKIGEMLIKRGDGFTSDFSFVCNQRGIVMYRQGKYTEALPFFVKSRDMDMFIKGSNSVDVAVSHQNIADALFNIGEMRGAKKAYKAAIAVRLNQEKKDNKELSQLYTDMAQVNQRLEDYKSAEEYFNLAYNIDKVEYGERSVRAARDLECLGELFEQKKQYYIAITNYLSALRIYQDLPNVSSNKISYLYNQIGVNYSMGGDFNNSREYSYKAYESDVKIYGVTNRESVVALNNVAYSELNCGNYAKAIELYEKSLELQKIIKSFSEKDVVLTYNSLGLAYSKIGKHELAKDAHYESLKRSLKLFGREHREVMIDYWNLALEFKAMRRYEEEKEFLRKSLDVALVLYDENSEEVFERYKALAECLSRLGKYGNESKIRKKILDIKLGTCKRTDIGLAEVYFLYGIALHNSARYETAVLNYMEAIKIYEMNGENFKKSVAVVLFNIGNAMMFTSRYQDALKAYEESYKIIKENNIIIAEGHFLEKLPKNIEESSAFARKDLCLVVKITKVLAGDEAKQLGVKENDIWLSIGDWRAEDALNKQADIFWKSASETWDSLKHTNRVFSIGRKIGDKWERKSFEFTKESGGFHYELISMERRSFDEMMRQCFINVK